MTNLGRSLIHKFVLFFPLHCSLACCFFILTFALILIFLPFLVYLIQQPFSGIRSLPSVFLRLSIRCIAAVYVVLLLFYLLSISCQR